MREAIAAIRAHVGRGELDDPLVFDADTVADDLPVLEAAIARMQFRVDDAT